jgi:hypothetical protein
VFTPEDSRTYAVANATVTLKVEALPDVTSLLTAHTQGPIGREVALQPVSEIQERETLKKSSTPLPREAVVAERAPVKEQEPVAELVTETTPRKPHETRTYKGVIYEKGDDGQWHRL